MTFEPMVLKPFFVKLIVDLVGNLNFTGSPAWIAFIVF